MTHYKIFTLSIAILLLLSKLSEAENLCMNKKTCSECVQTDTCAWCMQPDFESSARCFQPRKGIYNTCKNVYIWNPNNKKTIILANDVTRFYDRGRDYSYDPYYGNRDFNYETDYEFHFTSSSERVRITPQQVNLKLRLNQEQRLFMRYAQIDDFALDLYYLMDLSKSVNDEKETLYKLGTRLTEAIPNMSTNYNLGIGSFKNEEFFSKQPNEPCHDCSTNYAYKNLMSLSNDQYKFQREVEKATSSALDEPQKGLTALFQAIVCQKQIGWRNNARRILLYSTATGYHYEGSEELGISISPNDGACHLNEKNFYEHPVSQNYPSISDINEKANSNSINIIFAVTAQQVPKYEELSRHIENSRVVVLSSEEDFSNILKLILYDHYEKLSTTVEIRDNATEFVKIIYESPCLGIREYGEDYFFGKSSKVKCEGLKYGDIVQFGTKITATVCPENPKDWFQTIQIYPVGINDSLIVNIEMICDCPCERKDYPHYEEIMSVKCSKVGTWKCGICECDDSHYGSNCECSKLERDEISEFGCRNNNSTSIDCSGRGICKCGRCECEYRENPEEIISGKFCECDNFSCDRHNQEICSGLDHGKCECGVCVCESGWTGNDCSCRSSTETCIPPGGQEICSGHGKCECGFCACRPGFSGYYCETS